LILRFNHLNTNFKQKTIVLAGFLASMSLLPVAQAQDETWNRETGNSDGNDNGDAKGPCAKFRARGCATER